MKRAIWIAMLPLLLAACASNEKALVQQYQDVTPTRFEGAVAVVLENRETSTVDDAGESLVLEGMKRLKIMDRKAADCGRPTDENCRAYQAVVYDETWDEVEMLEARTITPKGEVIPVEDDDIQDTTFTSWAIPDVSTRAKIIELKGIEPGSILEWRYRVRSSKILGAGGFRFQERDPVLEASFSLDAPADYAYKWETFNIDVEPSEQQKGDRLVRTWTAEQVPPFKHEKHMVAPDDVLAQLKIANEKVSAFGEYDSCLRIESWEDMGRCWHDMIEEKQEITEGVREIVERIAAEAETDAEKVKAVWQYMNESIRYVGLEKGLAGFIPLSAGVVCSKKYGDCKAVAGLISVLCRELGLEADPILIGTRNALGQVPKELPGPFHFNHSIARVEVGDRVLWLDATNRDMSFDTTAYVNQGVDVVVARPGAPFMDRVPVQGPDVNRADGKLVLEPGADRAVKLHFAGNNTGNYAMMYRSAANQSTEEQFSSRIVERFLAGVYPQAKLEQLKLTGQKDNNAPFGLTIEAQVPNALQPVGDGVSLEVKSPIELRVFDAFTLPKRRYPVDLEFLAASRVRFEIQIPEGMVPSGLPRNIMFEDDYIKLERLAQIENDRLVARYDFSYKQLIIPPDEYAEARKSFQKAMDAARFVVMFEPPDEDEG